MNTTSSFKANHGTTIVELMISMTISLFLIAGVVQFMVSNKRTFLYAQQLSQSEENGRFASFILAKEIRMSGYNNATSTAVPLPFFGNCDDDWCSKDQDTSLEPSDRIAIQYDPMNDKDCNGNATVLSTDIVINVYWVEPDLTNNGENSLYCQGYNATTKVAYSDPQALIGGIETVQFLYGVHDDPDFNNLTKYVSSDEVEEWENIYSVKLAVLSKSMGNFSAIRNTKTYTLLDGETLSYDDGLSRSIYSTTVSINNAILE